MMRQRGQGIQYPQNLTLRNRLHAFTDREEDCFLPDDDYLESWV